MEVHDLAMAERECELAPYCKFALAGMVGMASKIKALFDERAYYSISLTPAEEELITSLAVTIILEQQHPLIQNELSAYLNEYEENLEQHRKDKAERNRKRIEEEEESEYGTMD